MDYTVFVYGKCEGQERFYSASITAPDAEAARKAAIQHYINYIRKNVANKPLNVSVKQVFVTRDAHPDEVTSVTYNERDISKRKLLQEIKRDFDNAVKQLDEDKFARSTVRRHDTGVWALNTSGKPPKACMDAIPEAIDRLAQYENTKHNPQVIRNVINAIHRIDCALNLLDPQ